MLDVTELKRGIRCELSSEPRLVRRVAELCRERLRPWGVSELSEIMAVVRELLRNAIEHGNRYQPERKVRFSLECLDWGRFKIVVEDEGKGFDTKATQPVPSRHRRTGTTGLYFVALFSDTVEFNEAGNRVTAYVSVSWRERESAQAAPGSRERYRAIPGARPVPSRAR